MATKQEPPLTFRPGPLLLPALEARAEQGRSPELVAKRDLLRYYELVRRDLPTFAEEEASLLVDAGNGIAFEPHTIQMLWAQVADAVRTDNLAEKWGVDGLALIDRLRGLTYGQAAAVCDAIERFWRASLPIEEGVRAVGLVR